MFPDLRPTPRYGLWNLEIKDIFIEMCHNQLAIMKHLLSVILIFVSIQSFGQGHHEQEFVKWYFKGKEPLFYTNVPSQVIVKEIIKQLSFDTLYSKIGYIEKIQDSLILTKKERTHIITLLSVSKLNINYGNVLLGSTLIERNIIDTYLRDRVDGWQELFEKYKCRGFYSFSTPILLRNNSICIFYSDYSCPSTCGEGALTIYKKEKGGWKHWLRLTYWKS